MNNIIVIGQEGIENVDSISWESNFPNLEEYDTIIIDLSTFPKRLAKKIGPGKGYIVPDLSTLPLPTIRQPISPIAFIDDSPLQRVAHKLPELRRACLTFLGSKRDIYCIMDTPVNYKMLDNFNYAWFPYDKRLSLIKTQDGNTRTVLNKTFNDYFNYVDTWNLEVDFNGVVLKINTHPIAG